MTASALPRPRVALFVTCLVDLYRPSVGFAALSLLREAGCDVSVPPSQSCCGQPAYNSGDRATATDLMRQFIDAFGGYDYVVAPSGSCAGMLRHHAASLFEEDPELRARAATVAERIYELTSFLTDVMGLALPPDRCAGLSATYHDSCSGLRELGVKEQPRQLLRQGGATITEMTEPEVCCGFGGTFCVKYPDISTRMVDQKARDIADTRAGTILAGDLGCLLNIAGRLHRQGQPVHVRHVAEVLAGTARDLPAIGEPSRPASRRSI